VYLDSDDYGPSKATV